MVVKWRIFDDFSHRQTRSDRADRCVCRLLIASSDATAPAIGSCMDIPGGGHAASRRRSAAQDRSYPNSTRGGGCLSAFCRIRSATPRLTGVGSAPSRTKRSRPSEGRAGDRSCGAGDRAEAKGSTRPRRAADRRPVFWRWHGQPDPAEPFRTLCRTLAQAFDLSAAR